MKKNWTMRVGALLLALTLITSCFVGGTFAKYTTAKTGENIARVAKFGVTVTPGDSMFSSNYAAKTPFTNQYGATQTWSVWADTEVVAPGTTGTMADFTITGTPEVAVKVSYKGELKMTGSWYYQHDDGYMEPYFPIAITVGAETVKFDPAVDTWETFINAVNTKISAYEVKFDAGTNLSGVTLPTITWSWPFDVSSENDVKDTYLGDLTGADVPGFELDITVTVEQID